VNFTNGADSRPRNLCHRTETTRSIAALPTVGSSSFERTRLCRKCAFLLVSIWLLAIAGESQPAPLRLLDLLWVWANPEMEQPGPHTAASFARAGSTERARLLGVPNIALAGTGVPNDESKAGSLTAAAAPAPRLVWETTPDGEGIGPPFVYTKRMQQIRGLAQKYPQIEAILLDDMSTGKIDRGFRAAHVRHIREQLAGTKIKIWGVVYTMSLGTHLAECIAEVDVINLWSWHARDTVGLERHVSRLENDFPNKPILLGVYLYDYGGKRRMPLYLLEKQCELARKLAHAGRVAGIVFLTIHDDPEAIDWVAGWVKRIGNEEIRTPASQPRVGAGRTTFKAVSTGFTVARSKKAIVRAMTAGDQVKIDSSHDEGQTWQPLSAIRQEWQQVAAGYFSQTPPDSLLLTITIGRKDGKDEARQVCWIRSRDGGRSWSRPAVVMNLPPHTHAWDPSRSRVKGDGLTVPTMKSSPLGKSVDFGRWSSGATILDGLGTRQLRFHSRQMETLE